MGGPETDDKWLWVDPFAAEASLTSGAVLLAEGIKRYVEKNVLVSREDFGAGQYLGAKLKGAGYTMTPDPNGAWTFDGEGEVKNQVVLYPTEDSTDRNGPFYLVRKHSLVYIRLRQQLRIPYYFIGRHNLKITYVYQGLLLGTGPQVDPGYVGHLIIPLHNLTTRDVRVYVNKSFVSVDFVRTTAMVMNQGVPETRDELYQKYGTAKALLELAKVDKRRELREYLEGRTPQSAMGEILKDSVELKRLAEEFKSRKTFEIVALLAITITWMAAVVTGATFVRSYYGDIVRKQFDLQAEVAKLREEKELLRTQQSRAVEDLRGRISQLCNQLASAKGVKLAVGTCP